ncbi:MAG: GNAT family N-acetyltransferase [Prevotellaceae bacterium]|jgi:putative acetyltransferase|nr:GNAT family N-acetyltransferase [Prevotellaceae bacterium]
MTKQTILRIGKLDDLLELQQLFVDTVSTICRADYNDEQIKAWISGIEDTERWQGILTQQYVLIAEDKQRIVGFGSLDKGNYIDMLYVHKDRQNQRIAYQIYNEIEKEAKRQKQTFLTSDVSLTAKSFFEKMGFNTISQQTIIKQGIELINFKMTKVLTM